MVKCRLIHCHIVVFIYEFDPPELIAENYVYVDAVGECADMLSAQHTVCGADLCPHARVVDVGIRTCN